MEMNKSNNVLGGTLSVPTEEAVKHYLEVRKDIIQKIKEKCIMKMNIIVAKRLENPNESYDLDYSEIVNKDEKEAIDLGIQLLDDIVLTGLDMRRVKFPNYVMQYEVLHWDKWTKEDIHKIIMGSWKLPSLTILGNLESGNYSLLDSSSLYSNHMVDDNILVNFDGYTLYIDNLNEFKDAYSSRDVIERRVTQTLSNLSEDILDKQKDIAALGGTLSVPTEEEATVLMDTMEEFIAERLSMSEGERNIFDSIPEATRRLYGNTPKEIVANYLKEHE